MLGLVAAITRWRPSIPSRYSPDDYCARSIVHNSPSGPWWAADAFQLLASEEPQVLLRSGFLSAGRIELALVPGSRRSRQPLQNARNQKIGKADMFLDPLAVDTLKRVLADGINT